MPSKLKFLLFAVLAMLACLNAAMAQVSAAISGRVEDASGAPISGATVTVKNTETGATRVVSTDASGNYCALSLSVGLYEIRSEAAGFKAAVRTGVKIELSLCLTGEEHSTSRPVLIAAE